MQCTPILRVYNHYRSSSFQGHRYNGLHRYRFHPLQQIGNEISAFKRTSFPGAVVENFLTGSSIVSRRAQYKFRDQHNFNIPSSSFSDY